MKRINWQRANGAPAAREGAFMAENGAKLLKRLRELPTSSVKRIAGARETPSLVREAATTVLLERL